MSAEQPAAETNTFGVSVLVGVGAAAFRGPKMEMGLPVPIIEEFPPDYLPEGAAPPGTAPIDFGGEASYEPSSQPSKLEGPAVSFGVSLNQPLFGGAALRLGLEERFTLAAVLPLSGGSCFAGLGDILLTARQASWPVMVGAGPSLAVAELNVRHDDTGRFEEAGVIVGGAALLRLDLAHALPGSLDLVGHYGKPLNYDDGSSYRDLQLAFALRL